MPSPMMTTIFGRCPLAGVGAGCCACAAVPKPAPESADAVNNNEVPLNSRSRRFNPSPFGVMPCSDFPLTWSLLMTRSRPVAAAVVGRKEVRAALHHLAGEISLLATRVLLHQFGGLYGSGVP